MNKNTKATLSLIISCMAIVISCISMQGCNVSQSKAAEVLSNEGFTDVQVTGHAWFACSKGDSFSSNFTAVNPRGQTVEGSICCGVIKSCTVRW